MVGERDRLRGRIIGEEEGLGMEMGCWREMG